MATEQFILTLSCVNRPGIVAAVSTYMFEQAFNILEAAQFDDTITGRFFMRVVLNPVGSEPDLAAIKAGFTPIAENLAMTWNLRARSEKRRDTLTVS